jgi:3',5'-cyclic AMP phosphodiesterase CpdA
MSFLRIAHLSDPHFGTIKPGVREGLIKTLTGLQPDLILLTGDITQRARAWQFQEAREFTHALRPKTFIAVPGNHDIPMYNVLMRLFDPYRGFKRLFKDQLEKDHRHGDVMVLGLNSTSRWRSIQGDFNLKHLEARLKSQPEKTQVHLAAFHHPMDCDKPQDDKNLLKQKDESMQLFDKYGIDLILGGHIHDPYVGLSSRRYKNLQRRIIICVAGTCLSRRTRKGAPNSFNWIEVDTRNEIPKIRIERFDQKKDLIFEACTRTEFRRPDPSGWEMA